MKKILFLAALAVCQSAFVQAKTNGDGVEKEQTDSLAEKEFHLNDVVITGTRTWRLLKDAPIQTRLIKEEDIKKSDATNVQDLLQQEMPGVEFSYAMNQQINMNFAGFAGQSVLILVDGERLAGETMANVDFSRLNMNNVARVEIVRGAQSALWGSNAAGGVINIITKKPQEKWSANVNFRTGAHNEQRYGGSIGFNTGKVTNLFDVQHTTVDTYSVCTDNGDECQFRNVFGFRTWNFKDRITFQPTEKLNIMGHLGYYFKERDYNIDTPDRYRDFTAGIKGAYKFSDMDDLSLSYNFDQYDKSDYQRVRKLDIKDYSNVQHTVRAEYSHKFQDNSILTTGGDFMRDYLDSYQFSNGAKHQYSADVFAQYDWNVNDKWEIIAAGRWDYFSNGDNSRATGKLGFRYREGNLTLRGGYSGGFHAPTLKEKYMRYDMNGFFWIVGNENLKSETSHNFNASAEYNVSNYYFTASANYNFVHNKITNTPPLSSATEAGFNYVQYINVDNMQVFGVEATAQAKWDNGVGARISYNFTHEEVVGSSVTQYCPARPHSLTARIDWDKKWTKDYATNIALTGRFLSAVSYTSVKMAPPYPEYEISNPAYTIWKIQLTNRICNGVSVNLALDNILNYKPKVYYYNSPTTTGINLMAGVSVDINKLF